MNETHTSRWPLNTFTGSGPACDLGRGVSVFPPVCESLCGLGGDRHLDNYSKEAGHMLIGTRGTFTLKTWAPIGFDRSFLDCSGAQKNPEILAAKSGYLSIFVNLTVSKMG